MILRVAFNKKNYLKYIGHLDLMRLFHRSFNRAGVPIKYSEGFNPHPKFSIGNPLSLGIESEEEYMDIDIDYIPVDEFIKKVNAVLPNDIQIIRGEYLEKEESIASLIAWAFYEINFNIDKKKEKENLEGIFIKWLSQEEIIITRLRKKGKKKVEKEENIKSFIGNLVIKEIRDTSITIDTLLRSGGNGNLKPLDFIEALNRDTFLNIDMDSVTTKRLALYAEKDNNIYKPL
ncbi:TIGR03936 family radical SAM-associated protein [uncultured Tissierella sp.]|uniref:TIGR03936 family radical SAM-associated protein n=1 Tax=uncultured Tissierella sp. TaxID=448160 RepID=UPI0028049711|nr:TIGR03936 family radical SAM-associated protein [uncultured Tissierella sp.]MDU5080615.1 TIGR03936 family radical SAM-associated protein [Bacillota bacterium]